MTVNRKKIFRWLKIVLLIYAAIGITLFYLQEKLLFHPTVLATDYVFKFDEPFEEVFLPMNESDTLSMIKFFPKADSRKGVVLYFHGNMENVQHYAAFARRFTAAGYEVWMPDYPGFGKSRGARTEKAMLAGAMQVKLMADAIYKPDSMIIYGKSLGTGIAAYVAAGSKAKCLVLETPYYSIPSLFGSYAFIYPTEQMSTYKLPTHEYLAQVTCPVTIFHGTKDRVIPYRNAEKLRPYLKSSDKFITVENADHQNINRQPLYFQTIDSLLK